MYDLCTFNMLALNVMKCNKNYNNNDCMSAINLSRERHIRGLHYVLCTHFNLILFATIRLNICRYDFYDIRLELHEQNIIMHFMTCLFMYSM